MAGFNSASLRKEVIRQERRIEMSTFQQYICGRFGLAPVLVWGLTCIVSVMGWGGASLSSVRFANDAIVQSIDEGKRFPTPEPTDYYRLGSSVHDVIRRPVLDTLSFDERKRAQNTNALGEVPDSMWFKNRIGVRDVKPEEVALGGAKITSGLDRSAPLKVLSTKEGGVQIGFLVQDAKGDRYIVKFDGQKAPELETANDVIVQRLLWAIGYNTPEDSVFEFTRDDFLLADDATKKDASGKKVPLTKEDLDAALSKLPKAADGIHWRALGSKFLHGVPVGGYSMTGVRESDPNDKVPHELRRDVRGQKTFFSWLGHTDVKEDNTLDMWVESEGGDKGGMLVHYLVDFGKALGGKGYRGAMPHDGWAHPLDYRYAGASLLTFGLWKRPWEGVPHSELRGVGRYEVEHFDPAKYRSTKPYAPFSKADRFDAFWASKILMRFTKEHIDAVVAEGQFSDPRAAAYITDMLIARQRKTAAHWFGKVSPLDAFEVNSAGDGVQLCGTDLFLQYEFGETDSESRYKAIAYDYDGDRLGPSAKARNEPHGRFCFEALPVAKTHDEYTAFVLRTFRNGDEEKAVEVHVAKNPQTGAHRVVGIVRH